MYNNNIRFNVGRDKLDPARTAGEEVRALDGGPFVIKSDKDSYFVSAAATHW